MIRDFNFQNMDYVFFLKLFYSHLYSLLHKQQNSF